MYLLPACGILFFSFLSFFLSFFVYLLKTIITAGKLESSEDRKSHDYPAQRNVAWKQCVHELISIFPFQRLHYIRMYDDEMVEFYKLVDAHYQST